MHDTCRSQPGRQAREQEMSASLADMELAESTNMIGGYWLYLLFLDMSLSSVVNHCHALKEFSFRVNSIPLKRTVRNGLKLGVKM